MKNDKGLGIVRMSWKDEYQVIKYRSEPVIIRMILQILKSNKLNKTQIKFKCCLSSRQMRSYFPNMLENKLIQYDQRTGLYEIGDQGIKMLEFGKIMEEHLGKT